MILRTRTRTRRMLRMGAQVSIFNTDDTFLISLSIMLKFLDPWTGSERDYHYDELLQRVFGIMRDKNPEMVGGDRKKFVMRPPQVRSVM